MGRVPGAPAFPAGTSSVRRWRPRYLGTLFDIHCGGKDHIPVHHTNEIAQTQACHQTRLANYWLHGYFLQTDQAKMAKSSGEFLRMQTLLERDYDPLAYRYLCLTAHYRSDLNFTWQSLDGAVTALGRLRAAMHACGVESGQPDAGFVQRFSDQVNDDLNTPRALATVWELVKSDLDPATRRATLAHLDRALGLDLANWQPGTEQIPEQINALLAARENARLEKRWQDADELRARIDEHGYLVEDTPDGPCARKK